MARAEDRLVYNRANVYQVSGERNIARQRQRLSDLYDSLASGDRKERLRRRSEIQTISIAVTHYSQQHEENNRQRKLATERAVWQDIGQSDKSRGRTSPPPTSSDASSSLR